jgi:hypothetical protein
MALDPRARRSTKQARRADGVTIAPAPGARKPFVWLVVAAALVLVAALLWSGPPRRASVRDAQAPAPQVAARAESAPPERAPVAPRPALHPVRIETKPVTDAPPPAPAPPAEPVPPSESAAPETPSGIGLFPPPGTDPPKVGLVVPDDFPLPEGYVRHYQVTDDGQPLPAILMFHPDYVWMDDAGNPVEVPDGVVPPELAPEGMPLETVDIPEPRDGGAQNP